MFRALNGATPPVSNITLIDSQVCTGTTSCNHAVTNAIGDLIVVIETNFNAACSTVPTDGASDTFTNRYDFAGVVSEGHQCGFDTISTGSNQTVTAHGASFTSANIRVYRGTAASPFDVVVGGLVAVTSARPGSRSLTGTTNELAIGWCEDGSSATNTFGTTSLWGNGISYPQATAGEVGFAADILNGLPGSQYGFAATATSSHNFGCGEILYKSAVSGSAGPGNFPTEFTGFENSTNGTTITPTILYAGMGGGNCVWTVTGGALVVSTSGQKDTVLNATTDGALYAAPFTGTRGSRYDPGNGGSEGICTFRQGHSTVTAGGWWLSPATIPDTTTHSLLTIALSGSDFVDVAMSSGENFFRCETQGGVSTTLGFTIAANTWYRLTDKYVAAGTHTCSVYDSSGTLLGTNTHAATGSFNATSFILGNSHGSAGTVGNFAYQDSVLIDELNGTFPLLP